MAKKERVRYDPERRLGWGRGFLKALEKAGPDIVAGVFATIDARADEFENPVFAQGVKTFAREVLDDAKSREDRAIALRRYSWTLDGAAFMLGRQDRRQEQGQVARDGASEKADRLRDAVRQVLDEHPGRIGPKSLRPAILKKLDKAEDTPAHEWPTERTIKAVLGDVRRERGIPPRQRAS
jgi:hypothetical protein